MLSKCPKCAESEMGGGAYFTQKEDKEEGQAESLASNQMHRLMAPVS